MIHDGRVPAPHGTWALLAAAGALAVGGCGSPAELQTAQAVHGAATGPEVAAEAPVEAFPGPSPDRGAELYAANCAACHGDAGAGDGPAAYLLSPAPRDFTRGRFLLVSTENGAPTEGDLVATLERGMPGSAMPAWEWMPESDLRALARTVRELALEGGAAELLD